MCLFSLRITKRGLGNDTEQSLEAAHFDFAKIWNRYLVRDMKSAQYSKNLLQANVDLTS